MNVVGGGKSPLCRADGSFASDNLPFAWGGPLLYEAAQLYNGGAPFIWSDTPLLGVARSLYRMACTDLLWRSSPSRPPARNSLRQCSARGTHAAVPTATSPLPWRQGYKKRPAVSHDRSLILLMVSDKRTRDVNSRMKIRSCATNDLRLPNEPLKSEFEIGCCKYSLFHSSHQNPNAFFSYTTEEISFLSLWTEKTLRF